MSDGYQWIQVNWMRQVILQGIKLGANRMLDMWVTHFKLSFSDDGNEWNFAVRDDEEVMVSYNFTV